MYNFSSYPALYVFKDGEMLDPYFGGREVDDLVFWMANLAKGSTHDWVENAVMPWLDEQRERV